MSCLSVVLALLIVLGVKHHRKQSTVSSATGSHVTRGQEHVALQEIGQSISYKSLSDKERFLNEFSLESSSINNLSFKSFDTKMCFSFQ